MKNRVFVLQISDLPALGKIRCWPGMQAAEHEGRLWLRCPIQQAEHEEALRILPALDTYREGAQGLLFRERQLTPESRLPQLNWVPLVEFIPIELPTAAFPALPPTTYSVKLVTVDTVHQSVGLKTTLEEWQKYAEMAPAIRLDCLRFALSEMGEVMILGQPLPPIDGEEFWQNGSALLPAGYDFEWQVIANLVELRENAEGVHYLLFDRDGSWGKIEKKFFVPASRAGIRLSKRIANG